MSQSNIYRTQQEALKEAIQNHEMPLAERLAVVEATPTDIINGVMYFPRGKKVFPLWPN